MVIFLNTEYHSAVFRIWAEKFWAFQFLLSLIVINVDRPDYWFCVRFWIFHYRKTMSSFSTTDQNGSDWNSGVRGFDVEDHFEPSLFAECSPPVPGPNDDMHTTFLAANLLLLYLNLVRMPVNDSQSQSVAVEERDRQNKWVLIDN